MEPRVRVYNVAATAMDCSAERIPPSRDTHKNEFYYGGNVEQTVKGIRDNGVMIQRCVVVVIKIFYILFTF